MQRALKHSVIFLVSVLFFISCGGGSTGTGASPRIIEGSVISNSGAPIEGVEVVILTSGESDITDVQGKFSIATDVVEGMVSLEIKSGDIVRTINVSTNSGNSDHNNADSTKTNIEITLGNNTISAKELSTTAKIVGVCDIAFENNAVIRQSNRLANGTICTLESTVFVKGKPVNRAAFLLQYRDCKGPWHNDALGFTGPNGRGTTKFKFSDGPAHCEYRVQVPYNIKGVDPLIFPIHTFRKQRFDRQ